MTESRLTPEILDRQPPRDLRAEMGVLGSILLRPELCDELALAVHGRDFYDDANAKIFDHMIAIHDKGRKVDSTLLIDRLTKADDYESVGGAGHLANIISAAPHAGNALHYAEIVRGMATLRGLINAGSQILQVAYDSRHDPREALNSAEEAILAIRDRHGAETDRICEVGEVLREALDELESRMAGKVAFGTPTGFADLDKQISLRDGELIILAARPSMGKTALATNIAVSVAEAKPVLFVSLEMGRLGLADRLLASESQVDSHRMQQGQLAGDERRRIVEAASVIGALALEIDDTPSRTMGEISAVARRMKRKRKSLGLVIVDYLQLIQPDDPKAPREQQVARIANRMKHLARELSCPVLCLAQLNRGSEAKADKKPELSNLRESGAIEQDADIVLFVHRDEYYHPEDDSCKGWADILVKKNRNGPTGELDLVWQGQFVRFCNAATKRQRSGKGNGQPSRSQYEREPFLDEYNNR